MIFEYLANKGIQRARSVWTMFQGGPNEYVRFAEWPVPRVPYMRKAYMEERYRLIQEDFASEAMKLRDATT